MLPEKIEGWTLTSLQERLCDRMSNKVPIEGVTFNQMFATPVCWFQDQGVGKSVSETAHWSFTLRNSMEFESFVS